jgi:flagellar assembly protein FliH
MNMSEQARARPVAVVERWAAPAVEGPIIGRRADAASVVDRQQEAALHARGYEAGVAAGRAEMQSRLAEVQARITRLDSILTLLARPLEELDAAVEHELALLALTIGQHLLRRELKTDPAQIIAIIREAVGRLPAAARDVRVHLHPEDAAVVRERLPAPATERAWSIIEDPALARGGCLVRTETSQVDARLESRVSAVIAAALGEERATMRSEPAASSKSEP